MISPNVLKLFVGSINMVDFSQNLKSFISQLSSDFRNNKLQKHQENVQHFHLFKFRKDVKREFLCRNDFVNKNVQVTENVPVVSRLLDVETQSWTVVCGRTEPWHQPERSFCLFVFFLITSLYWFFRIISVHTTVCLTDAQNIVRTSTTTRETFTDTRKITETETSKKKRILISGIFILTSLFLQLYFCSVTQQTENFKSLNENVTLEVQNQTLRDWFWVRSVWNITESKITEWVVEQEGVQEVRLLESESVIPQPQLHKYLPQKVLMKLFGAYK